MTDGIVDSPDLHSIQKQTPEGLTLTLANTSDGEKLCSSHAREAWNDRSVDTDSEQSEVSE